ncbi:MAG: MFS transporter [Actinomycetales bacterium]|nr:MFS transporter [Actinomycetales bacterium]
MSADDLAPEADQAPVEAADRRHWVRHTTLFLSGQTVSLFGSSIVQYAILWYLTLQTQSGVVLTLATAFGFLPQAVFSIFGGVWADRHNRKFLLIGADATIAATTLVLAVLLWQGVDSLWLIYITLMIRSAGAGIQMPAVGALLPQIVPTHALIRVNGINMSIQSAMTLIAPAAAAAVFAWLGLGAVLLVDVGTALVGIGLVVVIPVATLVRTAERRGYFGDLKAGLRYVRSHAVILRVLVFFAIVFVLMAPPGYLSPLMVVRTFGEEVWRLTLNELAFGLGMLAGGAIIAAWGGWHDRMRMLTATSFAFGLLSIALGLSGDILGWSGTFALYLSFMLILGVAVAFFSTTAMTLFQEQVEPEMQGRVFGVQGIVMALAMPIGMLIFGPMADVVSVEWIAVIAGLLTLLVTATVGYHAPKAPAPGR